MRTCATRTPRVLIICEGSGNYNVTFAGPRGSTAPEEGLTALRSLSVIIRSRGRRIRDKLVYSDHIYPYGISMIKDDSGPAAVGRSNSEWGYLVRDHIAPVWIGEAGFASPAGNRDDPPVGPHADRLHERPRWRARRPQLPRPAAGVSNTWWLWGYDSDGITQNANGSLNPTQYRIYRQWRPAAVASSVAMANAVHLLDARAEMVRAGSRALSLRRRARASVAPARHSSRQRGRSQAA